MAIDDQKHRSALTVHQSLEELNEHLRTHAAFDDHEPVSYTHLDVYKRQL